MIELFKDLIIFVFTLFYKIIFFIIVIIFLIFSFALKFIITIILLPLALFLSDPEVDAVDVIGTWIPGEQTSFDITNKTCQIIFNKDGTFEGYFPSPVVHFSGVDAGQWSNREDRETMCYGIGDWYMEPVKEDDDYYDKYNKKYLEGGYQKGNQISLYFREVDGDSSKSIATCLYIQSTADSTFWQETQFNLLSKCENFDLYFGIGDPDSRNKFNFKKTRAVEEDKKE
ncbi:MAG: hypothetical protein M0Q48_00545 [Verrucomicrobia bacterium]|nr:hypothetical protein [Verrucomicrobiota bacterium]